MLRTSVSDKEPAAIRDLEVRTSPDESLDLRLWLKLMTVHKLVRNEISRRIREEFALTLPRFDLMSQLRRNAKGMRMVEVSRRLMVTNGNVTAITDQLEREGLVQRTVDIRNRSAFLIKMTPRGAKVFDAIAKEHQKWLVGIHGGLTQGEKKALLALLGKHKKHLGRHSNHLDK